MNQETLLIKPAKTQYTEQEVAGELGISLEELRALIRSHIVETDEDLNNVGVASFHPCDLLVLKHLLRAKVNLTSQG